MRYTISIVLVLITMNLKGQSINDWWYFGDEAGIHFTSSGPVADTSSDMYAHEGSATVSSQEGDLLFYTNGIDVYNALHQVMPNGDSLLGNESSTQSSVIVPYPGVPNKYCIFTTSGCSGESIGYPANELTSYLFSYTVVDMCLEGGLGDVDVGQKNIILYDSAAEKVTVSRHANGTDLWLIGMIQDKYQFNAFRLSSKGIVDTVISTYAGTLGLFAGTNCGGYMLANHAGDKMGVTFMGGPWGKIELYDFDQSSGVVMPDPILVDTGQSFYGFHFSPNDSLLYYKKDEDIMQYDSLLSNVQAFGEVVGTFSSPGGWPGAFSEGPDGKIYIARMGSLYLSSIENPNAVGPMCNVLNNSVSLAGRMSRLGLPNSVSPLIYGIAPFIVYKKCLGEATSFYVDTNAVETVSWNFGDPSSPQNTSTAFNPDHVFTDTGTYTVELIYSCGTQVDTVSKTIFISPRQTLNLGPDTSICSPSALTLDIKQAYSKYLWHDGSSADSFIVTSDELVSVTLFGVCDTLSDTIDVKVDLLPAQVSLPGDTFLCDIKEFTIVPQVDGRVEYEWSNGERLDSLSVSISGEYVLTVSNACDTASDSMRVDFLPIPSGALLPSDTTQCIDEWIVVDRPVNDSIDFYWQDSSSVNSFQVDSTLLLVLTALNECGSVKDSMSITFNEVIKSNLGGDTTICPKESIALFGTDSRATYLWSTGETTDTIWSMPSLDTEYTVTITLGACQLIDSRRIIPDESMCAVCSLDYGNVFTPNGDGVNDRFSVRSNCEDIHQFELYIYNRWGQLVDYAEQASEGWDGYVNGKPASEGVYFFVVKNHASSQADKMQHRGSFTLLF